jgi:hypothetical protein
MSIMKCIPVTPQFPHDPNWDASLFKLLMPNLLLVTNRVCKHSTDNSVVDAEDRGIGLKHFHKLVNATMHQVAGIAIEFIGSDDKAIDMEYILCLALNIFELIA